MHAVQKSACPSYPERGTSARASGRAGPGNTKRPADPRARQLIHGVRDAQAEQALKKAEQGAHGKRASRQFKHRLTIDLYHQCLTRIVTITRNAPFGNPELWHLDND